MNQRIQLSVFCALVSICACVTARAADAAFPTMPNHQVLFSDPDATEFRVDSKSKRDGPRKLTPVEAKEVGAQKAYRITSKEFMEKPWEVQLNCKEAITLVADRVYVLMWMTRAVEAQNESLSGTFNSLIQDAGPPYGAVASLGTGNAPSRWTPGFYAFRTSKDMTDTPKAIRFHAGYRPQVLEFAAIRLLEFPKDIKIKDLPAMRLTYEGIEPDAPWRKKAAARIKKYRTGTLRINVVDRKGKPVPNAKVDVHQDRNAFYFGTAVRDSSLLDSKTSDGQTYRAKIPALFNSVVIENMLKWKQLDSEHGRARADQMVKWLEEQNIPIRGHNLIWPGWRYLPERISKLKDEKKALRKEVDTHIKDTTKKYAGRIYEWDVINEAVGNKELQEAYGAKAMKSWFKLAQKQDRDALLFINDYGILSSLSGPDTPRVKAYLEMIQELKKQRAPLGGIGLQAHFSQVVPSPDLLMKTLDYMSEPKLPIAITEFDTEIPNEEDEAQFLGDLLTVLYSQPNVRGFMMWGFWDGAHWKDQSPLFRKDWSEKPGLAVWKKLVLTDWLTRATVTTNAQGVATVQGHCGSYTISIGNNTKKVTLTTSGESVTLLYR